MILPFLRHFLALLLLCSIFPPIAAFAQDADYSDVPEKYIKEAQKVYRGCTENRTRILYYDCKCFAMKFLDVRIEKGPIISSSSISLFLEKECRDATEAAGDAYGQCLRDHNNLQPGTDPEKFCECYANTFADLIEDTKPMIESKTIVPLKTQANIRCSDKSLALRLYGRAKSR